MGIIGRFTVAPKKLFLHAKAKLWDEELVVDENLPGMYIEQPWLRRHWEQRHKYKPIAKLLGWVISLIAGALILKGLGL
jgi:hypothetical protein